MNDKPKEGIIYIATDRMFAKRLKVYGGPCHYPNIESLAENGTVYDNAIAAAGSTVMCHLSEWTGKYTWDIHDGIPYKERLYRTTIPPQDNIFTDLHDKGYDVYVVMSKTEPRKCYESFEMIYPIWPDYVNVRLVHCPGKGREGMKYRKDQFEEIFKCVQESRKRGKKYFIWMKCHGHNWWPNRKKYLNYAGEKRYDDEDIYNSEIDDCLGTLMDSLKEENANPEIWFASDHGRYSGEMDRYDYGYYLGQEIIHVPLIRSHRQERSREERTISMRQVRNLLSGNPEEYEHRIFSETLWPGQVSKSKSRGIDSMAKISVIEGRYKYIYCRYGPEGTSERSTEHLYDLKYDPYEKFDMCNVFREKHIEPNQNRHRDNPNPPDWIKWRCESFSRYRHSNSSIMKLSNFYNIGEPASELSNSIIFTGWADIHDTIMRLRTRCRDIWKRTGRTADYVRPPSLFPEEYYEKTDGALKNFVILCAGQGTRFSEESPKCLTSLGNQTILSRLVGQINKYFPKSTTTVVLGYQSSEVKDYIVKTGLKVSTVINDEYADDKNIQSALVGLENIKSGVMIVEGDCVFDDSCFLNFRESVQEKRSLVFVGEKTDLQKSNGAVEMSRKNKVLGFKIGDKSGISSDSNMRDMTGAIWITKKDIKTFVKDLKTRVETLKDKSCYYFQPMFDSLERYNLYSYRLSGERYTFNTLEKFQELLKSMELNYKQRLFPVEDLKHIEEFSEDRVQWLMEKIDKEQVWDRRICVSPDGKVMDGQHRMEVAKLMGLSYVPALVMDYGDIEIYSLHADVEVSLEDLEKRVSTGDIYPYKTVKHMIPPGLSSCEYKIEDLKKIK